eukprot:9359484-Lingulodinium_polyedra.AAC.1
MAGGTASPNALRSCLRLVTPSFQKQFWAAFTNKGTGGPVCSATMPTVPGSFPWLATKMCQGEATAVG